MANPEHLAILGKERSQLIPTMCLQELGYIVQSSVNVKTLILKRGNLVVFFDAEKLAGKPIKLVRMLVAAKAVKILDLNIR